uniref:PR domain zinc finger protein 12-like n=1 Tax=Crassostrea virginica TaxID=6565 RepID=A0A8B8E7Y2_CRAVI|nr:PR domain zinc finger protein 12-like [Crassostrea virginica]
MTQALITEEDLKSYLNGRLPSDCEMINPVLPSPFVPRQVCIRRSTIPGALHGVFSKVWIRRGTEMGPFAGRTCGTIDTNVNNKNTWEVFDERGEVLFYVDGGSDIHPASWLTCVQCARNTREQNLEVVQINTQIFYRAVQDIAPGEEFLVWYGQTSIYHLGLPMMAQNRIEVENNKIILSDPSSTTGHVEKLRCVLCRRGFNSRSNLRSHMRIHTMEKPFSCKFCTKSFSQSSTLRNHVRLHTGERPYKCYVCRSSYSQLAGLRAHQRSSRHKPVADHEDGGSN